MNANDSWKLLIFRDGRRVFSGPTLLKTLFRSVEKVRVHSASSPSSARQDLIEALLRAGELECGLADSDDAKASTSVLMQLTDLLAESLVGSHAPVLTSSMLQCMQGLNVPERLAISPPEGFCYYALHPLDYCDLLNGLDLRPRVAAVVGIRSIGTTLSAVVASWFKAHAVQAERLTVRPIGDPFDRRLSLRAEERSWVKQQECEGAAFFVVDEGPGLSGSSFLAVAEALEREGVSAESIVLLPSSEPDLGSLIAPHAAERWKRYRFFGLSATKWIPAGAALDLSAGKWRSWVFPSEWRWPPVWSWTERQKYLSGDGRRLFRFDGHGHYGNVVRRRAEILAENGWGPRVCAAGDGFSEYEWLHGNHPSQATPDLVLAIARYCAFRAETFSCELGSQHELEEMARVNLERAVGFGYRVSLPLERPVIPDGRMMPHGWLLSEKGDLLKLDAASHGDDHFYPGATDIAWDLAGTIVEWELDAELTNLLLSHYGLLTGDKVSTRLPDYLMAYSAFRLAFTWSGGQSVPEQDEKHRFAREADKHLARLQQYASELRIAAFEAN